MAKKLRVKSAAARRQRINAIKLDRDTSPDMLTYARSRDMFNLTELNGSVKPFFGVGELSLSDVQYGNISWVGKIVKMAFYRRYDSEKNEIDDMLVFYMGADKPLRYMRLYGEDRQLHTIDYPPFTSTPNFINYRLGNEDVLIISSPTDSLMIWNGKDGAQIVANAPKINSMCMHYERLFATDSLSGSSLWFSDDLDPRNWNISLNEAGYIEIVGEKGKLLKVISFLDYLYIFRSYGISRLSAFSEQTDFAISELYNAMSKIYEQTVTFCKDRIIFLSADGLCEFDGLAVSRLELGVEDMLKNGNFDNMSSCYFEGKFYLAFRYDFSDGYNMGCEVGEMQNNVLLVYDTTSRKSMICRGVDIMDMCVISSDGGSAMAVAIGDEGVIRVGKLSDIGRVFGKEFEKSIKLEKWNYTHFGKLKILKYVYFLANCSGKLTVFYDDKVREFAFSESGKIQRISAHLVGEEIGLKFSFLSGNGAISSLAVEYEVAN